MRAGLHRASEAAISASTTKRPSASRAIASGPPLERHFFISGGAKVTGPVRSGSSRMIACLNSSPIQMRPVFGSRVADSMSCNVLYWIASGQHGAERRLALTIPRHPEAQELPAVADRQQRIRVGGNQRGIGAVGGIGALSRHAPVTTGPSAPPIRASAPSGMASGVTINCWL